MNTKPAAPTFRSPDAPLPVAGPPLYPSLLGADWDLLAASVRRAHCTGSEISRTGMFRIERSKHWLGRLLARCLRLPKARDAANVRLVVRPNATGEIWRRDFDGRLLVTRQLRDHRGRMIERFAGLEIRVRLRVENGGLIYDQVGAALCWGWFPLPAFLAPRVIGSEMPDGLDAVQVRVCVTLPLIGLLIAYEGRLNVPSAGES